MTLSNATDRRVQRTRRALRDSLIAMILERGWEDISVQDLCERANVGRSTFYTHFADKEDVLVSGFDDLRDALRAEQRARADRRPLGFTRGLIDHAAENRRLFRAIVGKRSGQVVQKRFRELLIGLVHDDLAGLAPAGPRGEAAVHYVAGALFELLIWWVDARGSPGPAEVDELFHRLTTPVLRALATGAR